MLERDLLKKVRKLQANNQWEKAVECLSNYIDNDEDSCTDTVIISYAKSLRVIGKIKLANEVLIKARQRYPFSTGILVELYYFYDYTGSWHSAKAIANQLISMKPNMGYYYYYLGRTYTYLLRYKDAKNAYKKALVLTHGYPIKKLIEKIKADFGIPSHNLKSNYIFINGRNNLGAFIHKSKDKKYFTKISNNKKRDVGTRREITFYKNLLTNFPILKSITPSFIHTQSFDEISYITTEMIDSLETTTAHIKEVIEASKKISTVRYQDIINAYPPPKYAYQFKRGRAISVVHFFTKIEEERYNQKIFDSVYGIINRHRYPDRVKKVIQRLESAIMNNHLYNHIIPTEHYTLLHGDFWHQNILIDKNNGTPRIIDWTTYTIGPHFIDLARFYSSLLVPYTTIKQTYLDDPNGTLSVIERIFFLYAIILFYFQRLGKVGIETQLSICILPALEELERLVLSFTMDVGYLENLTAFSTDHDLKKLENQADLLQRERTYVNNQLNTISNSLSWKISSPLRLLSKRKMKTKK